MNDALDDLVMKCRISVRVWYKFCMKAVLMLNEFLNALFLSLLCVVVKSSPENHFVLSAIFG